MSDEMESLRLSARLSDAQSSVASSQPWPYGGGYTCSRCGSYVPNGCSHFCPGTASIPYSPPAPPVKWDRTQEILDAIHALTAAVDRLVEKFA